AQGRVLLTAPDGSSLDCLDLWTGAVLWRVDRTTDDIYVAGVYKHCVVVVGKQYVGAFRLQDGDTLWAANTDEPSGLGVAAGNAYSLPVRNCPQAGGPAVIGIDLEKGTVLSRTRVPGDEVPGNLIVAEGTLISQTATRIAGFPCGAASPGSK